MYNAVGADGKDRAKAHIGERWGPLHESHANAVTMVQASDDELTHILNTFPNISRPPVTCRVARWFGDEAKFIAANVEW